MRVRPSILLCLAQAIVNGTGTPDKTATKLHRLVHKVVGMPLNQQHASATLTALALAQDDLMTLQGRETLLRLFQLFNSVRAASRASPTAARCLPSRGDVQVRVSEREAKARSGRRSLAYSIGKVLRATICQPVMCDHVFTFLPQPVLIAHPTCRVDVRALRRCCSRIAGTRRCRRAQRPPLRFARSTSRQSLRTTVRYAHVCPSLGLH